MLFLKSLYSRSWRRSNLISAKMFFACSTLCINLRIFSKVYDFKTRSQKTQIVKVCINRWQNQGINSADWNDFHSCVMFVTQVLLNLTKRTDSSSNKNKLIHRKPNDLHKTSIGQSVVDFSTCILNSQISYWAKRCPLFLAPNHVYVFVAPVRHTSNRWVICNSRRQPHKIWFRSDKTSILRLQFSSCLNEVKQFQRRLWQPFFLKFFVRCDSPKK